MAGAADAAAGRAERHRDARRRPRLRRPRLLRHRDRHAAPRRARAARASGAPTSTPRRCARRRVPRCSPGSSRTAPGFGTVAHLDPGFPGYAMELAPDVATIAEILRDQAGLRHDDGGEVAPREGLGLLRRRARSTRGRASAASTASTGSSTRSRTCTIRTASCEDNHLVEVDQLPRRLLLHRRPHRSRDLDDPRAQKASNPEQPFFLLLRARRGARAAARPARGHRQVPRPLRRGLGRAAGRAVRPPAGARHRRRRARAARRATPSANHDVRPWDDLSRATSSGCSPGTWRSTRGWSTASTRTSGGWSPRSTSSASSTTRSSCSSPTTARHARAR